MRLGAWMMRRISTKCLSCLRSPEGLRAANVLPLLAQAQSQRRALSSLSLRPTNWRGTAAPPPREPGYGTPQHSRTGQGPSLEPYAPNGHASRLSEPPQRPRIAEDRSTSRLAVTRPPSAVFETMPPQPAWGRSILRVAAAHKAADGALRPVCQSAEVHPSAPARGCAAPRLAGLSRGPFTDLCPGTARAVAGRRRAVGAACAGAEPP